MSDRDDLEIATVDLVIANRILGHEDVTDASGHVSMRHPGDPNRYLMSRARSPQLVQPSDIIEFTLDNDPIDPEARPLYHERFIHGAIYRARPDVNAIVHAHAEDVLPFTITRIPLRPVIGSASGIGDHVPVWDIRDRFGDRTNLLVSDQKKGDDLAASLGEHSVVLLRGHGFAAARSNLMSAVRVSVFLPRNARVLMNALRLGGEVNGLTPGEIDVKAAKLADDRSGMMRGWEYWATRAGCADLLAFSMAKSDEQRRGERSRNR
jgi:HCOMODA/2-hydroxy-3-carboxy-muconic semialdehyde decarboxylase